MIFSLFTILPFTVCLFWMVLLLLDWRRDNPAQHVLAAFMGVSAALYLCHAAFFNHESSLMSVSESIYAFCNIGVFPLYYLYICRLTDPNGLSLHRFIVLIPALVIGLWTIILKAFYPGNMEAETVRMTVMRTTFIVQMVPLCWICFKRLKAFDIEIENCYADTENRSVRLTTRMMVLLVIAALISGGSNFLGREYFDSSELLICIPSILFTVLLFGVGYVGNRQEFCIDDLLQDEKICSRIESDKSNEHGYIDFNELSLTTHNQTRVNADELSEIISRLDNLMTVSRIYLHPDLRLSEVAAKLGVGRTTLSQRINQELLLSFSEYINKRRVENALVMLSNNGEVKLSLAKIAELSGFSSDSSFYRAFRRHTGLTPKQYLTTLYP